MVTGFVQNSRMGTLPLRAYCLMQWQCRAGMPHRGIQCLLGTTIADRWWMQMNLFEVWRNAGTQFGFLGSDDFSEYTLIEKATSWDMFGLWCSALWRNAISHLGNLGILESKSTHVLVLKSVFERNVVVCTAILSVYTKDVNILTEH